MIQEQPEFELKKIEKVIDGDTLEIIPLGGGREVGRSCILIKFKGKMIMLDCGIHPAGNDLSALPFFDMIEPSDIDVLLVTHFHLDHCGALPYFTEKTNFSSKVFMTHPTKAIYKMVLTDSLKVSLGEKTLFEREDIDKSMEKINVINFHEEVEFNGIKFTCYNAGHVLGAAMFLINIAGTKILYTGDYSREVDRHIKPAEIPGETVDILIVESTYGTRTHDEREVREKVFLETVHKIIKRNGNVLLPVFVLGRAQELLLMLDEYWGKNPELETVPIYYVSVLMAKCMLIFQTYINMTGDSVKDAFKRGKNPFNFKYINSLRNIDTIDDRDPSVVMASPGMLQKGLSKALFERWCHNDKNGVIFTGYCVESTLARDILNGKKEIKSSNGEELPIRMSVDYVSFSAHADCNDTKDFIEKVSPKYVVLVHGEKHEAKKLQKKLDSEFKDIQIFAPKNWQIVEIGCKADKVCYLEGKIVTKLERRLAELVEKKRREEENAHLHKRKRSKSKGGKKKDKKIEEKLKLQNDDVEEEDYLSFDLEGVMVKKNFDYIFLDKEEVSDYIGKDPTFIHQVLKVPYNATLELAYFFIAQIYPETVSEEEDGETVLIKINPDLTVELDKNGKFLIFKWIAEQKNDIIADCLALMFSQLPEDPNIDIFYEACRPGESEESKNARQAIVKRVLSAYADSTYKIDGNDIIFNLKDDEDRKVKINLKNGDVSSSDDALSERFSHLLKSVIERAKKE